MSYVVTVKSKVEVSQNFVDFSEYMNFNKNIIFILSEDLDDCTKNGPMVIFICGHQPKLCRAVGRCENGGGGE